MRGPQVSRIRFDLCDPVTLGLIFSLPLINLAIEARFDFLWFKFLVHVLEP